MIEPASAGSSSWPDDLAAALALVRHGQSTFVAEGRFQGRLDPPLSPLGAHQAARVAAWLASGAAPGGPAGLGLVGSPRQVIHSPLARAAATARLIADAQQPASALAPDDAFVEIGQGDWEGRTMAEVTALWGERLAAWRRNPVAAWAPEGEPPGDAARRVRDGLDRTVRSLTADDAARATTPGGARPWAVIVAHDGILRLLLLALLDLPLERFWSFPFRLCGVTVVDLRASRAQLVAHNLAGHLADLDAGQAADGAL